MRYPDIEAVLSSGLNNDAREPDGLLHCSKHTWWPLRFSQLEMAGKPMQPPNLLDQITMLTGTLHHNWIEEQLKTQDLFPFELVATEIDLTDYLPGRWTGRADWVFYDKENDHCILGDYKTIKPEGLQYLNNKPKDEHCLQLSAYYYALEAAGYTMAPNFFVFYMPKGRLWTHEVKPAQIAAEPYKPIFSMMKVIEEQAYGYVAGTSRLADMPAPDFKHTWNKLMNVFDVKQHPTWMETYTCPFDETLCPRTPIKKIGHWGLDRKWYSKYALSPHSKPTEAEFKKRGG